MGLFDFVGDIFGGVADVVKPILGGITDILEPVQPYVPTIGGIYSAASSIDAQREANSGNINLMRENNAFNAEQAAVNRSFQDSQATRQMDFQRSSQERAFELSQSSADKQMAFQSSSLQRQFDFQERMANTAYQRAIQDIKAAGLNPMLAYSQGGAATPSGGAASGSSASVSPQAGARGSGSQASGQLARVENAVAAGLNTGFRAAEVSQSLKNMQITNENLRKQGKRIDAETEVMKAQVPRIQQETLTSGSSSAKLVEEAKLAQGRLLFLSYQAEEIQARIRRADSETKKNKIYADELMPVMKQLIQANAQLSALEIPGAANAASAQGSWWMKNVSPYLPDVGRVKDLLSGNTRPSTGLRRK